MKMTTHGVGKARTDDDDEINVRAKRVRGVKKSIVDRRNLVDQPELNESMDEYR